MYAAQDTAYDEGFSDGYDAGLNEGYDTGLQIGKEAGFLDGYDTGVSEGYATGLRDGKKAGYAAAAVPTQEETPVRSVPSAGAPSVPASDKPAWSGVDPNRKVYVSDRSKTVHTRSNCSGMQYYTVMSAYEAYGKHYARCSKCW